MVSSNHFVTNLVGGIIATATLASAASININFGNGATVCGHQKASINSTVTFDPKDCSQDIQLGFYGLQANSKTEQADTPLHSLTCDAKVKSSLTQVIIDIINEPINDFYGYVMVGKLGSSDPKLNDVLSGKVEYKGDDVKFATNRGGMPPAVKDTIYGCP